MTTCLVCSCNRTMKLDAATIGHPIHTGLCRHEVNTYLDALGGSEDLVVACTQEAPLFEGLAAERSPAPAVAVRFVNIREMAGWTAKSAEAQPKVKALLAIASLPAPDAVPAVTYRSAGRLCLVGPASVVLPLAEQLVANFPDTVTPTAILTEVDCPLPVDRSLPIFSAASVSMTGHLGSFKARWQQVNPIDLDLCVRCGACVAACPEGAIDDRFQVDLNRCKSSRDCVKACESIGAISFDRMGSQAREDEFDLVLDCSASPIFPQSDGPMGYRHVGGASPEDRWAGLMSLAQLVGEFEKPKFFKYDERLCAHGRNGKIGCRACVDVCSTVAISSHFTDGKGRVEVNPNLCLGCGACTTVCPSGAMRFATPDADVVARRLRLGLSVMQEAGATARSVLFFGGRDHGEAIDQLEAIGRRAMFGRGPGIPTHMLPLEVHHAASIGLEVWLAAIAYGAQSVSILLTGQEAAAYQEALAEQVSMANAVLAGLDLGGDRVRLFVGSKADPAGLEGFLNQALAPSAIKRAGTFAIGADKRTALETVMDHLIREGVRQKSLAFPIALPAGSPMGGLVVDNERCTLCMSCVGACPEQALKDGSGEPLLLLIEKNCVQCGLCVETCPEAAIALAPRISELAKRREPSELNRAEPFCCIRCGKPFATKQGLAVMLQRIGGHPAFAGEKAKRLEMCGDCRVVDMVEKEA
ncbi:4Fe-4S ferredoxin-type, iron-sulphur binding domain containing protein [Burkholderiales bacterium]